MPTPLYSGSPSRLMAWLDCPRRYRMQYLDRPKPAARPQRAHTSVGIATHNVLRDFWDLPPEQRTPAGVAELVRTSWIDVGFRDPEQSAAWRTARARGRHRLPCAPPTASASPSASSAASRSRPTRSRSRAASTGSTTATASSSSSTTRRAARCPPTTTPARRCPWRCMPSRAHACSAARCRRVELHHVPTGTVAAHEHTDESLERKVAEAESIASDLRRADADYAEVGVESDPLRPADLRALLVVRLPRALPGGSGPGSREVRLGRPRALRLDRQERP